VVFCSFLHFFALFSAFLAKVIQNFAKVVCFLALFSTWPVPASTMFLEPLINTN